MLASLISERYAKALLRAAQAENALDAVGVQARGLELALRAAGGAERFLADPVALAADKLAVIEGAFEGGMHPLFKAFLKAVLHQKRERFLPRILGSFRHACWTRPKAGWRPSWARPATCPRRNGPCWRAR